MAETSEVPGFDAWFNEPEGYALRSERFDGDVAWLRAAYEAGVAVERERCAAIPRDLARLGFSLPGEEQFADLIASSIRTPEDESK